MGVSSEYGLYTTARSPARSTSRPYCSSSPKRNSPIMSDVTPQTPVEEFFSMSVPLNVPLVPPYNHPSAIDATCPPGSSPAVYVDWASTQSPWTFSAIGSPPIAKAATPPFIATPMAGEAARLRHHAHRRPHAADPAEQVHDSLDEVVKRIVRITDYEMVVGDEGLVAIHRDRPAETLEVRVGFAMRAFSSSWSGRESATSNVQLTTSNATRVFIRPTP